MDFNKLVLVRESCRSYDKTKEVEAEKLDEILEAARLAPSACNGQPYHLTVCRGNAANEAKRYVMGMGMNKFCEDVPVFVVISEEDYVKSAAVGAKIKKNDYRSMDIGLACAYLTCRAAELGLGTCILGWFDDEKLRALCKIKHPVRLVIAVGYPKEELPPRTKKRKALSELVTYVD